MKERIYIACSTEWAHRVEHVVTDTQLTLERAITTLQVIRLRGSRTDPQALAGVENELSRILQLVRWNKVPF